MYDPFVLQVTNTIVILTYIEKLDEEPDENVSKKSSNPPSSSLLYFEEAFFTGVSCFMVFISLNAEWDTPLVTKNIAYNLG